MPALQGLEQVFTDTESRKNLGNGPIALLHDVLMAIDMDDDKLWLKAHQQSVSYTLMALKGKLLRWDGVPKEHEYPNGLQPLTRHGWSFNPYRGPQLLQDAEDCVKFLSSHGDALQGEPWTWLLKAMQTIVQRLSSDSMEIPDRSV